MLDVYGLAMFGVGKGELSLPAMQSRPMPLKTERLAIADEAEPRVPALIAGPKTSSVATRDPVS